MPSGRVFGVFSLLFLCPACSKPEDSFPAKKQMLQDPSFHCGFIALDPKPGKKVPYGALPGISPNERPVWKLAQWASKYPLQPTSAEHSSDGSLRYANESNAIILGRPGSEKADVTMGVNASVEYGNRARQHGESWPHLLAEQRFEDPPVLKELSSATLHVEAKLLESKRVNVPGYSPSLHAAKFQIYFTVQNLNRSSPGYRKYLWFGVPVYDDRSRIPRAFAAQDIGKGDATGMFIYTPAGETFTSRSAHDRRWITIDKDLLPLMKTALKTAWERGFLKDSQSLGDYSIASIHMGWEMTGNLDVAIQVRKLGFVIASSRMP